MRALVREALSGRAPGRPRAAWPLGLMNGKVNDRSAPLGALWTRRWANLCVLLSRALADMLETPEP